MHGLMNTWDWFWTVFMGVAWIVIIGATAFVAVEVLKQEPRPQHLRLHLHLHHRHH